MKIPGSVAYRSTLVIALLSTVFAAPATLAQSLTDFEDFTAGVSVNGQNGWRATNPNWDEEVVQLTGNKAWRVSNLYASGSFGDQPFARPSGLYAGETTSTHVFTGNPAVTNTFHASFDIWPVVNEAQPGLDITVSPDDGQGSRQSYLSIEDNGNGIDIDFYDSDANHAADNPNGGFRLTEVATGLEYGLHNIAFEITFVDGNDIDPDGTVHGNDIVNIYIDGSLVHTGTTWESYFWTTTEGQTPPSVRAVDTLLFRLSTDTFDGDGGFYIDNVLISDELINGGGGDADDNATFNVTKTFSNGMTDEVDVTLTCNGGLPLEQTATIAGGDPDGVTFTVQHVPDSGMNCEVTESGGPAGYVPEFNGGEGCAWTGIGAGAYSCEILNSADAAVLTINTEWLVDEQHPDPIDPTSNFQVHCSVPFDGATAGDDYYRDYSVQGQTASVEVTGISIELTGNGNSCYVEMTGDQPSGLETVNGCGTELEPIVFSAGSEESCTITNTVFFEGIPTLDRYGIIIMALVVLGAGMIGVRRLS